MSLDEWVDFAFICGIIASLIWGAIDAIINNGKKKETVYFTQQEEDYNALVDFKDNEELKLKKAESAIKTIKDIGYLGTYKDEFSPRAEKMYEEVKALGESESLKALRADLASALISFYVNIPTEENAVKVEKIYQETKGYLINDDELRVKIAKLAEPLISFYFMMLFKNTEQDAYPKNIITKAETIYKEVREFGSFNDIKDNLIESSLPLLRLYREIKVADQSLVNSAKHIYAELFSLNNDAQIQPMKQAAEKLVKEIHANFIANLPYKIPNSQIVKF
ncbi:hypothetical protein [Desulfovibrio litoralis]|uniref:Uncharacterized protein n=1 Tax=Desulfovibrio litoralis DSM 11393 TaxID=1121455 RepID=A0A1M7TD36_9BACT|nr:hypothetical protein [Desulfovibrio litoralis]SHN68632.1 hypothetical protein SAMN02745728_01863 [Desulfovibrio litoralis DSM 11393]